LHKDKIILLSALEWKPDQKIYDLEAKKEIEIVVEDFEPEITLFDKKGGKEE